MTTLQEVIKYLKEQVLPDVMSEYEKGRRDAFSECVQVLETYLQESQNTETIVSVKELKGLFHELLNLKTDRIDEGTSLRTT